MDRGAWWATVHGATKSRTWLSDWSRTLYSDFLSFFRLSFLAQDPMWQSVVPLLGSISLWEFLRLSLVVGLPVLSPYERKTTWRFLQKLKTELTYNHQHHCWVFIQKSWDQDHQAMSTFSIDHLSASQSVARPHVHRRKYMMEKIRRHPAGWPFLSHKTGLGSAHECDH